MSELLDQEWFFKSCSEAASFPMNLVYHDTYEHNLRGYFERLNEREAQLFCKSKTSVLDFWEYVDKFEKFQGKRVRNICELKEFLGGDAFLRRADPKCRFVFIHAPNSREWLNTSREMMTYALTHHQVMPSFLEFIFPFGRQEHARDFHFSGFRQEARLENLHRGLHIPELRRSGRELRMAYSLKSVEPSPGQTSWPWSIRQTAIYHSLDIETGVATWIIVKGNQEMQRRMESITESSRFKNVNGFETPSRSFASSLVLHSAFCDWCGENWRWYINFLEEALEKGTRRTLAIDVESIPSPTFEKPPRSMTWSTTSSSPIKGKRFFRSLSTLDEKPLSQPAFQPPTGVPPPPPPPPPPRAPMRQGPMSSDPADFSFGDLQRVQFLEDKTNEVLLVLDANIGVLTGLKMHYQDIRVSDHMPEDLLKECRQETDRNLTHINGVISDLRMQQDRIRTLLRLVADRKSLLYGILDYRNSEANRLLAIRAQESTENMEFMTRDMHVIAQKTKQETVSMRIITLVTLFFLPGTYISTIMSTDIIKFQVDSSGQSHKVFQLRAVQLYLAITVPLTLVVFAAWYGVYYWVDKKEQRKRIKEGTVGV